MVEKIFNAIKDTATSEVIVLMPRSTGKPEVGTVFSIQVVNVGAEAGNAIWTFTYLGCLDPDNAPFVTPSTGGTIKADYSMDGNTDRGDIFSFNPKSCTRIKIKATLVSGTVSNGLKIIFFSA